MEEEAGVGGESIEEEGEDFDGAGDVEVEGAVAEFELAGAAREEAVEGGEEGGEGEEADGGVVGGDAVVAAHGAAARGFDVEQAVGEVGVGVFVVGELDRRKIGRRVTANGRGWTQMGRREEIAAEGGEGEVAFAGDSKVG